MASGLALTAGAAPSTPASGLHALYVAVDGAWHTLSDAGVDAVLAGADIILATANITDEAITNAKLADMGEETIKGRTAGAGTGEPQDLTATAIVAMIADEFSPPDEDAEWTALTLGTGWELTPLYPTGHTYSAPAYRNVAGVVYLRGAARKGTSTAALATLPADYRPAYDVMFTGRVANQVTLYKTIFWVNADGAIRPDGVANATYHLDGICFVPA